MAININAFEAVVQLPDMKTIATLIDRLMWCLPVDVLAPPLPAANKTRVYGFYTA